MCTSLRTHRTFLIFLELSDTPVGTGTLYVLDRPYQRSRTACRESDDESDCFYKSGGDVAAAAAAAAAAEDLNNDDDDDDDDDEDESTAFVSSFDKQGQRKRKKKEVSEREKATAKKSRLLGPKRLVKESKALNFTEREESFVVQYLAQGGLAHFSTRAPQSSIKPNLVGSSVHSGAGQQTFGFTPVQRADLFAAYTDVSPTVLCYHNYHGHMWHYTGHFDYCPMAGDKGRSRILETTLRLDDFRKKLAKVWTEVRPESCVFDYSVSYACQMFHGTLVPSLKSSSDRQQQQQQQQGETKKNLYYSVKECLIEELREEAWLPPSEQYLELETLKRGIRDGAFTGFVVLKGGAESERMKFLDPAGYRFGFCVQQYAPSLNQISERTKRQIGSYFRMDEKQVETYLAGQPSRTVNSGTFHSEETVSTTYLRWLMQEREFDGFEITHFIAYQFRDWSKDFLEPVLQRRHECKLAGNGVAAECLKLIGNGSYGYNGLESCNYDTVQFMTQESLSRGLGPNGRLRSLKLKNISLVGMVKLERKKKKLKRSKKSQRSQRKPKYFEDYEACEGSNSEPESDPEGSEVLPTLPVDDNGLDPDENEDDDDDDVDDLDEDESGHFDMKHYKTWRAQSLRELLIARSNATPLFGGLVANRKKRTERKIASDDDDDDDDDYAAVDVDLEEELVRELEEKAGAAEDLMLDHSYSKTAAAEKKTEASTESSYHFLYSVTIAGDKKRISNCLPKAVSILSNSKRLFLGHLSCMFKCLDPCLAELAYIDTDSCIWSLTYPDIERCLRKSRKALWDRSNILADEKAPQSCHGKMKLEGLFAAGQFRSMKIYRLYQQKEEEENEAVTRLEAAYTRCKGVNRYLATKLPDSGFQSHNPNPIVVHRNALRPSKKGEIFIGHEARTVSVPFNLKRYVTSDGYHTLPFSHA